MFKVSRLLVIYAIAIPLSLFLGFLVTAPGSLPYEFIGILLCVFALPIFLKWHHALMIFFWNSIFTTFFLPGTPDIWVVFAALSFGISMLNHVMFQKRFLRAPELTKPLLCLAAVVLLTAWVRGGIGIRALGGGAYGGKKYIVIFIAICGYFAMTAERIPVSKGKKMAGLFFVSGTTCALSNIAYMLGPVFYFVYYFVPVGAAFQQAMGEAGIGDVLRLTGVGSATIAGLCFLLSQYGIRGLFDWGRPWRFFFLCLTVVAGFSGGYRGLMIVFVLVFATQFYLEGLVHTPYLPLLIGLALFAFIPLMMFPQKMPTSVQRVISFLPVNVNSDVLEDAQNSTEWRWAMWKEAAKDVPKYLIVGKGYSIDPNLIAYVNLASQNGVQVESYEGSLVASDFHSGPLSILIPFGIFGVAAFIWVLVAGYRVLLSNYRYGDPRLRNVNRTLLAYYIVYCFAFFAIFGAFSNQLYMYLGVCGLSVSLNGGVKKKFSAPRSSPVAEPATLALEPG